MSSLGHHATRAKLMFIVFSNGNTMEQSILSQSIMADMLILFPKWQWTINQSKGSLYVAILRRQ